MLRFDALALQYGGWSRLGGIPSSRLTRLARDRRRTVLVKQPCERRRVAEYPYVGGRTINSGCPVRYDPSRLALDVDQALRLEPRVIMNQNEDPLLPGPRHIR